MFSFQCLFSHALSTCYYGIIFIFVSLTRFRESSSPATRHNSFAHYLLKDLIDPQAKPSSPLRGIEVSKLSWVPYIKFYSSPESPIIMEEANYDPCTGEVFFFRNWLVSVQETLELQRFPFDRQVIGCTYGTNGDAILKPYKATRMYGTDQDSEERQQYAHLLVQLDLPVWKLHTVQMEKNDERTYTVEAHLERDPLYYLYNVVLVLALITVTNVVVCNMDADDLGGRMGVTITLLLTAVAFKFVLNAMIPQVSMYVRMFFMDVVTANVYVWI